jgi:hypothetical protein
MRNLQPTPLSTSSAALAATAPALAPGSELPTGDEMMTLGATCAFFGGDKPLNPSTLYRGIKALRYPPPVRVGPNLSRWLRSECRAAREALIAARDTANLRDRGLNSKVRCGR